MRPIAAPVALVDVAVRAGQGPPPGALPGSPGPPVLAAVRPYAQALAVLQVRPPLAWGPGSAHASGRQGV